MLLELQTAKNYKRFSVIGKHVDKTFPISKGVYLEMWFKKQPTQRTRQIPFFSFEFFPIFIV